MSVDFYTCGICSENWSECDPLGWCADCEEVFCPECKTENENDAGEINKTSCVFCTNKIIPVEILFEFARGLLGLSKEEIENMYRDRKER